MKNQTLASDYYINIKKKDDIKEFLISKNLKCFAGNKK